VAEEACLYYQAYINKGGKLNFAKTMQMVGVLLYVMDFVKMKSKSVSLFKTMRMLKPIV